MFVSYHLKDTLCRRYTTRYMMKMVKETQVQKRKEIWPSIITFTLLLGFFPNSHVHFLFQSLDFYPPQSKNKPPPRGYLPVTVADKMKASNQHVIGGILAVLRTSTVSTCSSVHPANWLVGKPEVTVLSPSCSAGPGCTYMQVQCVAIMFIQTENGSDHGCTCLW